MSKITEIKSACAGDMYYKIEHDSGLTIYLYPKSDYNSKYAIFEVLTTPFRLTAAR